MTHYVQPEGLAEANLSDYFDLGFVTLPHKLLQPDEFDRQTSTVRNEYFTNGTSGHYILKPDYHRQIPADGLSHYLKTIWVGEETFTRVPADISSRTKFKTTRIWMCQRNKNFWPSIDAMRLPQRL